MTITVTIPGVVVSAIVSAFVGALLKATLDWLIKHRRAGPENRAKHRTHRRPREQQ